MTRWCLAMIAAALVACARDEPDTERRDGTDTGAAEDVIGRPEGADSIPPDLRQGDSTPPESLPARDTGFKRPEQRPIRDVPPLTRPDTTRPDTVRPPERRPIRDAPPLTRRDTTRPPA
jgi:hypothetical protein